MKQSDPRSFLCLLAFLVLFLTMSPDMRSFAAMPISPEVGTNQVIIGFESVVDLAASKGKIVTNSPAYVVFEPGVSGHAIRFVRDDNLYSATVQFPAALVDFSDHDETGRKLEFWLKFNEDPHIFSGNKFLFRAYPVFMIEIYGSKPFLAFEFYGNGDNDATRNRFITYTQGWTKWEAWKAGEWHKISLLWKRNGKDGNAEMHLYIDDTQEGCDPGKCNDYQGILPAHKSFDQLVIGNYGKKSAIDFSMDQMSVMRNER